jgi:1,2-diacylglycerol 3-beta-galactosyltransferase
MALTHRYLLAGAASNVRHALERHRPAVVVSFHPLTGTAAVEGRRQAQSDVPIVTVVTDLATVHRAWRDTRVDRMAVATAAVRGQCRLDGLPPARCLDTGLPVRPGLHPAAVPHDRFVVLVVGGGEGSGGMGRQVEALVERFDDITVVAVCGRNQRLRRRLDRLASFRLIVTGFVDDLAQWMSAADVLVTKAGPGTIAEAACCGTPLILTSFLPGQEEGNIDHVMDAGAGRYAPTVADLLGQIDHLRRHPPELASMGAAALRMSRPHAAADIAHLVAGMAAVGRAPAASARA